MKFFLEKIVCTLLNFVMTLNWRESFYVMRRNNCFICKYIHKNYEYSEQ